MIVENFVSLSLLFLSVCLGKTNTLKMEPVIAVPIITQPSNFFGIFAASLNTPQLISNWELRNGPYVRIPYFGS